METVSREVNITNLQVAVEIKTVSGDIAVRGLAGKVNLETVSGKIIAERLFGNLTARTVSGLVEVHILLSNDFLDVPLSSVSGNVTVFVYEKEEVQCIVETVSGRFNSEIPLEIHEKGSFGRRTFQGHTGEPHKIIVVKTISRNVSLKKLSRGAV